MSEPKLVINISASFDYMEPPKTMTESIFRKQADAKLDSLAYGLIPDIKNKLKAMIQERDK